MIKCQNLSRPKMLVGFSASRGFFRWLVRWWTQGEFDHVFVLIKPNMKWIAIDIAPPYGVRAVPMDKVLGRVHTLRYFACKGYDRRRVLKYFKRTLGRPYGFREVLGFVLWRISSKVFGWYRRSVLDREVGLVCSRFAVGLLEAAGLLEIKEEERFTVHPQSLFNMVSKSKNFEEVVLYTRRRRELY